MAIYWVDPYIESYSGGIHGTSDTSSKTGTYSAPWSFTDVLTTGVSTGNFPNSTTLSDGDEIRLKGLPRSSFLVDAGSNYYANNYYRVGTTNSSGTTMNSYLDGNSGSQWTTANGKNGWMFCFDPTYTDQLAIADSSGDKPLYFFGGQYTKNSSYIQTYSGSGFTGHGTSWFQDAYPNSGAANATIYFIDPQYYIDTSTFYTSGIQTYFCVQSNVDITVTDGWTSETQRNGYTLLPFYSNFSNFNPYIYFNQNGNNTSSDTLYDIPKTYFLCFDDNSTVARFYYYVNSAHGVNKGNSVTQKIGGLLKSDYGYPTYIYNSNYYSSAGTYNADSCNNLEINYTYAYYALYLYGRYGVDVETRLNNIFGYQAGYLNFYGSSGSRTFKFGNYMTYSGSSGASFSNTSSNASTVTFENIPGSIIYTYNNGGGIFSRDTGYTFNLNTPFHNYTTSTFLDNAYNSSSTGPTFKSQVADNSDAYTQNIPTNPTNWYDAVGIFHDGRSSTPHYSFQENMALGVLQTDNTDYRTLNPSFQVKTDKYLYSYTGSYNADTNIHFSSNDFDGRTIGACLSYNRNNSFHYPVLYYNDSANSNALCFQSNASGNLNDDYKKNIEVPVPAYTTESLKFKADFETSANWDKTFRIDLQYVNNLGARTTLQLVNVSSSVSRVTYETTIPNANLPQTDATRPGHMNAIISFENSDSPTKKVWVHEIAVELIT